MRQSNKGFLLIDSLVCIFVVASMCTLCFSIYKTIVNYNDGYLEYQDKSNERYEYIFNSLSNCEACEIDESD